MPAERPDPTEGTSVADAAPKQTTASPPPVSLANPEHPWLGLESFREETRKYFFGRDAEIAELHLRLRNHPLLVLYGRSGLGKTSILTAGLIPRLRAEQRHPLLLRLRYDELSPDSDEQLVAAVFGQVATQGVSIYSTTRPVESRRLTEDRGEY
jgi:hypothetical protein